MEQTYEYTPGQTEEGLGGGATVATADSPEKKAGLAMTSALHDPRRVINPFGEKLALSEDHDAPHPDALSDKDYGQPCLTCQKTCPGFFPHRSNVANLPRVRACKRV